MDVDVWVIDAKQEILVTDFPGPPMSICGYVSEDAKAAAEARGYDTVSEIGFPSSAWLGHFPTWEEALATAEAKNAELNYKIVQEDSQYLPDFDNDYEEDYEPDFTLDDLEWDEAYPELSEDCDEKLA